MKIRNFKKKRDLLRDASFPPPTESSHYSLKQRRELNNLEDLTEIFSFFTPITAKYARPTCRWWNGLLSKDNLITSEVKRNTDGEEVLEELRKDMKAYKKSFVEFTRLRDLIPILICQTKGKSLRCDKGKKKIKEINSNLSDCRKIDDSYEIYHPTLYNIEFKQKAELITKFLNNKKIFVYDDGNHLSIESDYGNNLTVVLNHSWLRIKDSNGDSEDLFEQGEVFILDSKKIKFTYVEINEICEIHRSPYLHYTEILMKWLKTRGFVENVDFVFYKNPNYVVKLPNYGNQGGGMMGYTGYPGQQLMGEN